MDRLVFPIFIFKEDLFSGIPPKENVGYSPGLEKAWFPSHGVIAIGLLKLSGLTPLTGVAWRQVDTKNSGIFLKSIGGKSEKTTGLATSECETNNHQLKWHILWTARPGFQEGA